MKYFISLVLFTSVLYPQVNFEDFFFDNTLRFDYFHTGDKENDSYSFDEMIEEPYWGGRRGNLLDIFDYGSCKVMVYDEISSQLIYSHSYSTLFDEWQTTDEASKTTKSFSESVIIPYPKNKIRLELYSRKKNNELEKKFEYTVDPANYFIKKERRLEYPNFKVVDSGDPSVCVDLVILPEGYTKEEMEIFKRDCQKFANYLFKSSPFKENKEKFNIWGVESPSEDSGSDIPADTVWKKTLLNTNFYTFDVERYCMTSDYKSVRDAAANAPYDQIYILVNSDKYGGGAIYNYYAVSVNRNMFEEYVFVHEFGHAFGFLADEYVGGVAYNEFYPLDVEPLERNLTTLVNFDKKWKDMVDDDIPIPTPGDKKYKDIVGVYEGGGYMSKGIYRPEIDCTMNSISVDNFCEVCKKALIDMINFYTNNK